jgi:assimilatory nitrate reductase catalytic subunit
LQAAQDEVAFASTVVIGRETPGVLFRAANAQAPGAEWVRAIDRILGVEAEDALRYETHVSTTRAASASRAIASPARAFRAASMRCARASGCANGWWRASPWPGSGRCCSLPSDRAPSGFLPAGRVVCQCWNVSERDIVSALAEASGDERARLAAVQAGLKCGTQCGSCTPELRGLARVAAAASPRMVA